MKGLRRWLQKHERLNSNSPHHVNTEWVQRLICNAELGRQRQGTPRADRLVRLAAFRTFCIQLRPWLDIMWGAIEDNTWCQHLASAHTSIGTYTCVPIHINMHLHNTHMKIKKELGLTSREHLPSIRKTLGLIPALQRLCPPKTESSMFFTFISYGGGG